MRRCGHESSGLENLIYKNDKYKWQPWLAVLRLASQIPHNTWFEHFVCRNISITKIISPVSFYTCKSLRITILGTVMTV